MMSLSIYKKACGGTVCWGHTAEDAGYLMVAGKQREGKERPGAQVPFETCLPLSRVQPPHSSAMERGPHLQSTFGVQAVVLSPAVCKVPHYEAVGRAQGSSAGGG